MTSSNESKKNSFFRSPFFIVGSLLTIAAIAISSWSIYSVSAATEETARAEKVAKAKSRAVSDAESAVDRASEDLGSLYASIAGRQRVIDILGPDAPAGSGETYGQVVARQLEIVVPEFTATLDSAEKKLETAESQLDTAQQKLKVALGNKSSADSLSGTLLPLSIGLLVIGAMSITWGLLKRRRAAQHNSSEKANLSPAEQSKRGSKKCPACAEKIKREASICKHCGAQQTSMP
jgi:hypothetical protein